MHPTIRDGEAIIAAPVSVAEVIRGDVVLCRRGGRVLAHRVVAIAAARDGPRFALRGDSQTSSRVVVGADDIVARIVAVRRHGRIVPLPGGWLMRRARLAAAWTRRTIVRAIVGDKSVSAQRERPRS
jgi:hypothetical protein